MMMMTMLSVQGLQVRFGDFTAVHGLDLSVDAGQSLGLVGESGSGKSTVLRAICGLVKPAAGRMTIGGDGTLPLARRVQMVFQDPYGSLHPRQTVDRMLAEPLAIHGIGDAERRVGEMLDAVALGQGFRYRYPHELSGGQRQRVAIARALMLEPQLLLLDEPTSALDASVQAEVLNLLDSLRRERGLSYLMVSHDLAVVTHLCERVMVMQKGREVETLAAAQLARGEVTQDYTRELMRAAKGYSGQ
jgi:peptide/nickel transport system ATP-binding protein